jgi:hypothetical protein
VTKPAKQETTTRNVKLISHFPPGCKIEATNAEGYGTFLHIFDELFDLKSCDRLQQFFD